ncbi:hypothetical protein sce8437 [Sorangium cellulosum So ce56]|uniref:Uncharacterized protein n=1 Tax=Sorangium cellulosum (strain So ce56) TaxID=448385 RepID=A9FU84_SORC5|nr:hypothetical protein [Sorangium cellulosum]CAN98607.1 hypothetical protein sce8437 [Sorangium cellulosum So ce56]
MVLGASHNEIALTAFLLIVVLLAAKIGRIGEAIGGLFERDAPATDGGAPGDGAERAEHAEHAEHKEERQES